MIENNNYSAKDIENVEAINAWLDERKLTKDGVERVSAAALARMSRVGASTLSQIINGVYNASPSKLIEQVLSAIRHTNEQEVDVIPAVETTVFKLVQTACMMARRNRNFSVISFFVGTGKTFSLRHYAKNNANTFLLEADATMTPQTIVKELARLIIGHDAKGTNYELMRTIVNELKNTDSLIVLDEAETVTPKQLEILRRIRDKANIGVVISGTEYLSSLIKPQHGQFDQIRSRTGFWPELIKRITDDDIAALVQAGFPDEDVPDDVIKRMAQYSAGSARLLVEGLISNMHTYRKEPVLTVRFVDQVAKQALSLKAND